VSSLIPSLFNEAISPAKVESIGRMIFSNNINGGCGFVVLDQNLSARNMESRGKPKLKSAGW